VPGKPSASRWRVRVKRWDLRDGPSASKRQVRGDKKQRNERGNAEQVYRSCIDRHCSQCGGGGRADWLPKTSERLLPKIDYFQVVFKPPDDLWPLMLGNRCPTYRLLFHAACEALREVLREALGCEVAVTFSGVANPPGAAD